MAEKNTLSILESIKKKMANFDEKKARPSAAFDSDDFDYNDQGLTNTGQDAAAKEFAPNPAPPMVEDDVVESKGREDSVFEDEIDELVSHNAPSIELPEFEENTTLKENEEFLFDDDDDDMTEEISVEEELSQDSALDSLDMDDNLDEFEEDDREEEEDEEIEEDFFDDDSLEDMDNNDDSVDDDFFDNDQDEKMEEFDTESDSDDEPQTSSFSNLVNFDEFDDNAKKDDVEEEAELEPKQDKEDIYDFSDFTFDDEEEEESELELPQATTPEKQSFSEEPSIEPHDEKSFDGEKPFREESFNQRPVREELEQDLDDEFSIPEKPLNDKPLNEKPVSEEVEEDFDDLGDEVNVISEIDEDIDDEFSMDIDLDSDIDDEGGEDTFQMNRPKVGFVEESKPQEMIEGEEDEVVPISSLSQNIEQPVSNIDLEDDLLKDIDLDLDIEEEEKPVETIKEHIQTPVIEKIIEESAAVEVEPQNNQLRTVDEGKEHLIDEDTAHRASQSIKKLIDANRVVHGMKSFSQNGGAAFGEMAVQLMEPKIEKWINDNLSDMVEKIVREEIQRIIPEIEDLEDN